MTASTWVSDLSFKFRQRLTELVDSMAETELRASTFREFTSELRELTCKIGLEAFERAMEERDVRTACIERDGTRLRYRESVARTWLTPFGRATIPRRCYASDGPDPRRAVPLDEMCGMQSAFMTPDVAQMAMFAVALITPREVEQLLAKTLPEAPSSTAVLNHLVKIGDAIEGRRQAIDDRVCESAPLSKDGDVLVASWDGVMIPMREQKGIKWREAGVATISTYGPGADGIEKKDTLYLARMPESCMRTLVEQIEQQVKRAKESHDFRQFVVLCDGKRGIWCTAKRSETLCSATFILDFFHAAEHLSAASKALFGDTPKARAWFEKRRDQLQLEDGALAKIQRTLRRALKQLPLASDDQETLRATIRYFKANSSRMRYAEFIAKGLPIGSGPVESAAKMIVQARLKRSGMHWSTDGGQRVLDLRCYVKSNRWDAMWNACMEAA